MKTNFDPWDAAPIPKGEEVQELQVQENGYWEIFRYTESPNNELSLWGEKRNEIRYKKNKNHGLFMVEKEMLLMNNLMIGKTKLKE